MSQLGGSVDNSANPGSPDPEQSGQLDDKATVLERRTATDVGGPPFAEDDEEITAGPILPAKAHIGTQRVAA
jgi:hypothetical protein